MASMSLVVPEPAATIAASMPYLRANRLFRLL